VSTEYVHILMFFFKERHLRTRGKEKERVVPTENEQ
jgi:hypothetical protein